MNSWFVWIAFALVAVVLGLIAYCFSLRVLRVTAAIVALVTAAYLTWYGLTHPANPPGGLSDAFARYYSPGLLLTGGRSRVPAALA
jgi:ABC-type branched-subunit amino acid transport system permease subunit